MKKQKTPLCYFQIYVALCFVLCYSRSRDCWANAFGTTNYEMKFVSNNNDDFFFCVFFPNVFFFSSKILTAHFQCLRRVGHMNFTVCTTFGVFFGNSKTGAVRSNFWSNLPPLKHKFSF